MKDSPSGAHGNKQPLQAGLQQGKPEEIHLWQPTPWSFSFRMRLRQGWWSCHSVPRDIKQNLLHALYGSEGSECFISSYSFHHTGQLSTLPAGGGPTRKSRAPMNFQSLPTAHRWQGDRRASQPCCLCLDPLRKAPHTRSWDAVGEGCRLQWYPFSSGPWKVAFTACSTLLLLLATAPCSGSHPTRQTLPVLAGQGAAGHLYLASGAQGQESSTQVIQGGLIGPLCDSLYKKRQLQEQTPFCAWAHMSKQAWDSTHCTRGASCSKVIPYP